MCCRMQSRREYNPFHNALDTSKKPPSSLDIILARVKNIFTSNTSSGDLIKGRRVESNEGSHSVDVVNGVSKTKTSKTNLRPKTSKTKTSKTKTPKTKTSKTKTSKTKTSKTKTSKTKTSKTKTPKTKTSKTKTPKTKTSKTKTSKTKTSKIKTLKTKTPFEIQKYNVLSPLYL